MYILHAFQTATFMPYLRVIFYAGSLRTGAQFLIRIPMSGVVSVSLLLTLLHACGSPFVCGQTWQEFGSQPHLCLSYLFQTGLVSSIDQGKSVLPVFRLFSDVAVFQVFRWDELSLGPSYSIIFSEVSTDLDFNPTWHDPKSLFSTI